MNWKVHGRRLPGYWPRVLSLLLALTLVGAAFYEDRVRIPRMLAAREDELRAELDLAQLSHASVLAVKRDRTLPRGTLLAGDALEALEVVERPEVFLPERVLHAPEDASGQIATADLAGGEVVTPGCLRPADNRLEGYFRLVSVPVRSSLLGALSPGRDVDLLAHFEDGSYEVLVSKTPVRSVRIEPSGKASVLVPLDDAEQRLVERLRATAHFSARLYLDATQPASLRTAPPKTP